jgi:hypothetical protein
MAINIINAPMPIAPYTSLFKVLLKLIYIPSPPTKTYFLKFLERRASKYYKQKQE